VSLCSGGGAVREKKETETKKGSEEKGLMYESRGGKDVWGKSYTFFVLGEGFPEEKIFRKKESLGG